MDHFQSNCSKNQLVCATCSTRMITILMIFLFRAAVSPATSTNNYYKTDRLMMSAVPPISLTMHGHAMQPTSSQSTTEGLTLKQRQVSLSLLSQMQQQPLWFRDVIGVTLCLKPNNWTQSNYMFFLLFQNLCQNLSKVIAKYLSDTLTSFASCKVINKNIK